MSNYVPAEVFEYDASSEESIATLVQKLKVENPRIYQFLNDIVNVQIPLLLADLDATTVGGKRPDNTADNLVYLNNETLVPRALLPHATEDEFGVVKLTSFIDRYLLSESGYVVLTIDEDTETYLIIQWGVKAEGVSTPAAITFPIAFDEACWAILPGMNSSNHDRFVSAYNKSITGFTIQAMTDGGSTGSELLSWIAIGR